MIPLGVAASAAAIDYVSEADALFARFTTPPTGARKALIDQFIRALKTAGVWAKLDCLYVLAAADAQAAQRNWVQDAYNLTETSSPTFNADQGYAGDGAASYLATGFTPSTAGGHFALNDAHLSVWSLQDTKNAQAAMGYLTARIWPNTGTTNASIRVNSATQQFASATGQGFYTGSRVSSSSLQSGYKNGSAVVFEGAVASTSLDTTALRILANSAGFWPGQAALASIGGGLTSAEALALYSAAYAYLDAVGAI